MDSNITMNKEIINSSYNSEDEGNEDSLENDEIMCELKDKIYLVKMNGY